MDLTLTTVPLVCPINVYTGKPLEPICPTDTFCYCPPPPLPPSNRPPCTITVAYELGLERVPSIKTDGSCDSAGVELALAIVLARLLGQ